MKEKPPSSSRSWLKIQLLLIAAITLISCSLVSLELNPKSRSQMAFERVVIDAQGPDGIWLKTTGDINGDNRLDLISGGNNSGGLVWYENPSWTKHMIDAGGGFSTDAEVVDVDNDGDNDLVVLTNNELRWYENPGWEAHIVDTRVLHDLEVADFDLDGDFDIVARNQGEFGQQGDMLHFYEQLSPSSWEYRAVTSTNGEGLKTADIDGDGDADVVINGSWFENTRDIVNGPWNSYSFTSSWNYPNTYVDVKDINSDGLVDIVLSPSELAGQRYRISWFEAPQNAHQGEWNEHVIEDDVEAVQHFVGAADFNNDSFMDVAAAEMQQGDNPDEIKIYLNTDRLGHSWEKEIIATSGSHSMRILDFDDDGDMDLFGANWQGDHVELFVNQVCDQKLDSWERHRIDSARPWRSIFITTADINADGDHDIVTGGWWYENLSVSGGSWPRHEIGSPLNNMAAVYDFDTDGDADILGTMGQGSDADPRFVWARNDGFGVFTILDNIEAGDGDFLQGVAVGRLEKDGMLKVALSWHSSGPGIQMLTVPDDPVNHTWTIETISGISQDEALSMGDIDQDGDQDLLLGTIWLENLGTAWQEHVLHDTSGSSYGESDPDRNRLADINNDGRLDAVVGYEAISVPGKLAWYEAGKDASKLWQEHIIGTVTGPMSLDVADMDRDGDRDVIVGEHNLDKPSRARLFVFENMDGQGEQWESHLVHTGDEHHDGAQAVDIDNDGDWDIVSIGWGHGNVLLYEQISSNCHGAPPPPEKSNRIFLPAIIMNIKVFEHLINPVFFSRK